MLTSNHLVLYKGPSENIASPSPILFQDHAIARRPRQTSSAPVSALHPPLDHISVMVTIPENADGSRRKKEAQIYSIIRYDACQICVGF